MAIKILLPINKKHLLFIYFHFYNPRDSFFYPILIKNKNKIKMQ